MDEDVKAYLQGMKSAPPLASREWKSAPPLFIAGEVCALHTQLQQSEARLGARLDSIDSRLKLQAGLIQSGARAMARFSEFAEIRKSAGSRSLAAWKPWNGKSKAGRGRVEDT